MTARYALFGANVGQSLSPVIYNAAFARSGHDAAYEAVNVRAMDLSDAIQNARDNFAGINLTAPHKETVLRYLDEVDSDVREVRAANTIAIRDGKLHGFNTDISGFTFALRDLDFDLRGKRIVVLGTGGAARAAVKAAIREGANEVVVGGRRHERSIALCESLCSTTATSNLIASTMRDATLARAIKKADLLVHATSVQPRGGDARLLLEMLPIAELSRDALAMDLAYSEPPTFFCEATAAAGRIAIDGRSMLLHQATRAYEIFTGAAAPMDSMREALANALRQRANVPDGT